MSDLELILKSINPNYEKEYRFNSHRRWKFDFAYPDIAVAFEYEGIFRGKSRHTSVMGYSKDCEKYNHAAVLGWRVIRITAAMLSDTYHKTGKGKIVYDFIRSNTILFIAKVLE